MHTWFWIIVAVVVISIICYILHKIIDHDVAKIADKVVQNAVKKNKPILTAGPYSYSEMYKSEDGELQLPLDHLKWLTIWSEPKHKEYRLQWASSILENHYRKRLPNNVMLPVEREDYITFAIDIAMTPDEIKRFTKHRKYEQIFLTVYDSNDTQVESYKIVVYYDHELFIRNNPSFA